MKALALLLVVAATAFVGTVHAECLENSLAIQSVDVQTVGIDVKTGTQPILVYIGTSHSMSPTAQRLATSD
jgi:hypothetical protein